MKIGQQHYGEEAQEEVPKWNVGKLRSYETVFAKEIADDQ